LLFISPICVGVGRYVTKTKTESFLEKVFAARIKISFSLSPIVPPISTTQMS